MILSIRLNEGDIVCHVADVKNKSEYCHYVGDHWDGTAILSRLSDDKIFFVEYDQLSFVRGGEL